MISNGRKRTLFLFAILVTASVTVWHVPAVQERVRRAKRWHSMRALRQTNGFDAGYISLQRFRFTANDRKRGDVGDLVIREAAYAVLSNAVGDSSVGAHHDQGIAYLVLGDRKASVEHLRTAAHDGGDAAAWNDLAVAYRDLARADDAPWELPNALTYIDRALKIDARFAPALYNRALLLDDLGITTEANDAWQRFIGVESVSEAASAARRRIDASGLSSDARWRKYLPTLRSASARRDLEFVRTMVKRFPQQARTWGETEFLFDWAEALHGGHTLESAHLTLARDVASALREQSGESMLFDTVATIEEAIRENDTRRVALLGEAHVLYRTARLSLYQHRATEALRGLKDAAKLFEAARSPFATVSSYYASNALAESGRPDEALHRLNELTAAVAPSRMKYVALVAQIDWEIGLCEGLRSDWNESLAALERSAASFHQLGEQRNEGSARNMIAECRDLVGDTRGGWRERVAASRLLGAAGDSYALSTALAAATFALIRNGQWEAARSLSAIDEAVARSSKSPLFLARSWMRRALIATELRDDSTFQEALREARLVASSMTDRALAGRTLADIDVVEAKSILKARPTLAARLAGDAIRVYETARLDAYLPDLLTLRARAYSMLDDEESAWNDLARGMDLLERQRQRISQQDLRAGIFDQRISLFDDAIRVALRRRDYEAAFSVSERARARTLLDELSPDAAQLIVPGAPEIAAVHRAIGDRTLVEFAVLPEKLVVFVVTRDRLSVHQRNIDAEALSSLVETFIDDTIEQRDTRRSSARLHSLLLGEIVVPETSAGLVIVPDGCLLRLPFAALIDPTSQRYLVERVPLMFAPSVAVHIACSRNAERLAASRPWGTLVVGDPGFNEARFRMQRLSGGRVEADAVAAAYPQRRLLTARDATRERFLAEAVESSIVHYAGHAVTNTTQPFRSFLLFAPSESLSDDGALYVSDIARMRFRRTRLVAIAACSTSIDQTKGREGSLTIVRSFLAAGVPAAIGTLWDIDDNASIQLFSALHRFIATGASPEEALRSAQIEMIRGGTTSSQPAHWASVILTGGIALATRRR